MHGRAHGYERLFPDGVDAVVDPEARHAARRAIHPRLLRYLLFFAIYTAIPAAISYAFLGRPYFAVGAGALAALAFALPRIVPQRMDLSRSRIEMRQDQVAILLKFRRVRIIAIVINVAQLALIVGCMIVLSVAMNAE